MDLLTGGNDATARFGHFRFQNGGYEGRLLGVADMYSMRESRVTEVV